MVRIQNGNARAEVPKKIHKTQQKPIKWAQIIAQDVSMETSAGSSANYRLKIHNKVIKVIDFLLQLRHFAMSMINNAILIAVLF